MGLRVAFELDDEDLKHFRLIMREARKSAVRLAPEEIVRTKPDYVLILPWNLKNEVTAQLAGIREWGGRFVIPIPRIEVI